MDEAFLQLSVEGFPSPDDRGGVSDSPLSQRRGCAAWRGKIGNPMGGIQKYTLPEEAK